MCQAVILGAESPENVDQSFVKTDQSIVKYNYSTTSLENLVQCFNHLYYGKMFPESKGFLLIQLVSVASCCFAVKYYRNLNINLYSSPLGF